MSELLLTPTPTRYDRPKAPIRRILLPVLYVLGFALVAYFFATGLSYYSTPYIERPHHPDYRALRPAGSSGLAFGVIGSVMMVFMLVYTLRKRTRLFGRRLPLRPFLDFHIFMGVFGPLLILLHTSFKVQGLVAIAFWSMVAVALSGYFGRYLYQQIPRDFDDRELNLQEIDLLITQLANSMQSATRIDASAAQAVAEQVEAAYSIGTAGPLGAIARLVWTDLRRPWTDLRLRKRLSRSYQMQGRAFEQLYAAAKARALLRRRLAILARVQRLFHYWHVIHKPFAIIMYIIMGVHIGVAIWTGYGWF